MKNIEIREFIHDNINLISSIGKAHALENSDPDIDTCLEDGEYSKQELKLATKIQTLLEEAQKEAYEKENYIYNLRFWLNESGTFCMEENCREGNLSEPDMCLFGLYVAESELLDKKDKKAMASFCKAYLSKHNP